MGTYTTAADCWTYFANFQVAANPRITAAKVEDKILEFEGDLHGALRLNRYTTPLTHASDIAVVKPKVEKAVAVSIYMELFQPQDAPDFVRLWNEEWTTFLEALRDGNVMMPYATPVERQRNKLSAGIIRLSISEPEDEDEL